MLRTIVSHRTRLDLMHVAAEEGDGSRSQEKKTSNEYSPVATKAAQLAAEIVASPLFSRRARRGARIPCDIPGRRHTLSRAKHSKIM